MRAFYSGFGVTLLRDVPFAALQFSVYEQIKSTLLRRLPRPGDDLSPVESAAAGAAAGAVGGCFTTPMDVIKTYVQTRHPEATIRQAVRAIAENEGWRGFGRGIIPRVLWTIPQGSILFFVYEFVLSLQLTEAAGHGTPQLGVSHS